MFLNPSNGLLSLQAAMPIVLGIGIVLFIVGVAWLRRITRDPEDGDDHWRFRR